MFLFKRKQKAEKIAEAEAVIQAIKNDTYKKIDEATHKTRQTNELFEKSDITRLIFEATGGRRRSK